MLSFQFHYSFSPHHPTICTSSSLLSVPFYKQLNTDLDIVVDLSRPFPRIKVYDPIFWFMHRFVYMHTNKYSSSGIASTFLDPFSQLYKYILDVLSSPLHRIKFVFDEPGSNRHFSKRLECQLASCELHQVLLESHKIHTTFGSSPKGILLEIA